jgi:transposase-like protein
MHRAPEGRFFQRNGYYHALCRAAPIPRFRCKVCGKRFSRQTFRIDYRDKKPHLNRLIADRLSSGTGLRRTALSLGISRSTVERKFHKMGAHLRLLHEHTIDDFGAGTVELVLDELETFETCRRTRPVTVPALVEPDHYFIVGTRSATLPPRGKLKKADQERVKRDARRFGKRRNRSAVAVGELLALAARHCQGAARIVIRSDRKKSYPRLLRAAFGAERIEHVQVSSRAPRTTFNPLFPINLTNAMLRDLMGRLHRRSWLASKQRRYLDQHLGLTVVFRNYVRPWKNGEADPPAVRLGFTDRAMTTQEMVTWRQDFGPELSIHPLGRPGETVGSYRRVMARLRKLRSAG